MPRRSRSAMVFGALCAASALVLAPGAAADPLPPVSGAAADTTIDELEAQGYNVEINWVNGFDTKPLSECWVTGVNDPGHEVPTAGTFVTVYVDVACPNGDDGGFNFGVGIG